MLKIYLENRSFYGKMFKYSVELRRSQMTIRRMSITCWISNSTNTYSEYIISTYWFPLQQLLHERDAVLDYSNFCFVYQGLSNTTEAFRGVLLYIHLTSFLFIDCWLGDELSAHVSTTEQFIFSYVLSVYFTAVGKWYTSYFCFNHYVDIEDISKVSVRFTCCWILKTLHMKCFKCLLRSVIYCIWTECLKLLMSHN
jgi:hypothetical protein